MKKTAEKFKTFFALILISAILLPGLTSCFDLGMFEDGEEEGFADYYGAFDEIVAVTAEDLYEYDLEDSLFNEYTVNHLAWEDDDDAVAQKPYVYIGIPCEKDMKIESVSFYLKGDASVTMSVYAFILDDVDDIPSCLCAFEDDPDRKTEPEDEDEEGECPFDDLVRENAIAETTFTSVKDKFVSASFNFGKGRPAELEDGQALVLYVFNNTGYGRREGKQCVSFSFLNLLIRAVE